MVNKRLMEVDEMPRTGSGGRFSRRGLMQTGMGVGAACLLPNLAGAIPIVRSASAHDHQPSADDKNRKDFTPGDPFVEPAVRSSANGACDTAIRILAATGSICGCTKTP